jgi:hypothetical protein
MSVDQMSVNQMSVSQMSVDQMSFDQMSVDQMVFDQMVSEQILCNHASVGTFSPSPDACGGRIRTLDIMCHLFYHSATTADQAIGKHKTSVEVADRHKHSSLLLYRINYSRKQVFSREESYKRQ